MLAGAPKSELRPGRQPTKTTGTADGNDPSTKIRLTEVLRLQGIAAAAHPVLIGSAEVVREFHRPILRWSIIWVFADRGWSVEADPRVRREARAVLTVMTWNVENFFAPQPADRAAYDAKMAQLAEVIIAAAPDLLALQEVGDQESFDALRDKLGAGWTGVLSTHFETPHTIRVGWLSPGDLSDAEEVLDLPAALAPVKVEDDDTTIIQLGRGALAVTYTTAAGTPIRALTAHLKSKLLTFPGHRFDTSDEAERARYGVYALDRRTAEAAALRDWATTSLAGEWADKALLVCGDLNDTMDAATTQLLFGPPGSQIGTAGFDHPDHGDPQRLWDVGYAMTPPNDYSRINQGRHELIDHILVSHAMVGHLNDATTVPLDVPSIGVQPNPAPRIDPPSDHRPVLAHFDL